MPSNFREAAGNNASPPQSLDAEQGVLGSMLIDPKNAIPQVAERCGPEQFYVPAHQTIYQALVDMWDSGQAVDLITFTEHLRVVGQLDSVGGPAAVTNLYTFVPSAANIQYYLDIVKDKYIRRDLLIAAKDVIGLAYQEQDGIDELAAAACRRFESVRTACNQGSRRTSLAFRTPAELIAMDFDDSDTLVGDRLLARGQPLTMLGQGGIGKSRILLQLLACSITGRMFGPLRCPKRELKWLIFQTENSNRRLKFDFSNLRGWLTADEFEKISSLITIHTLETDQDYLLNLQLPDTRTRISEALAHYQPDGGACFDPLYSFSIGDMNKDVDMIETVLTLSRLVKAGNPDRSIIVVHHALTGRAGAEKATGRERSSFGRNSKALQQWTRGQINVAPINENDYLRLVLSCGKNSNGREFEPFEMALDEETMIYEHQPNFDAEAWHKQLKDNRNLRKIEIPDDEIANLAEDSISRPDLVKAVMAEFVCKDRRARYAIQHAEETGAITYSRVTKRYVKNNESTRVE